MNVAENTHKWQPPSLRADSALAQGGPPLAVRAPGCRSNPQFGARRRLARAIHTAASQNTTTPNAPAVRSSSVCAKTRFASVLSTAARAARPPSSDRTCDGLYKRDVVGEFAGVSPV